MAAFTNYLEDKIVDHLFRTAGFTKPTALYVGLLTAAATPETGGVTEVAGGSYARVAEAPGDANWAAPAGGDGTTSNVNAITFPTATADWGTATHFGIWDAATAGNLLVYGALTASRNIVNGATPSFPAGSLTVQVDS